MAVATADPGDEVGPHIPPPYVSKSAICDPFGIGHFVYDVSVPERHGQGQAGEVGPAVPEPLGPSIIGHPAVEVTDNTACSAAQVQFNIQTKACGRLGCDWETRGQTGWITLPQSGRVERQVRMNCRKGVNSYRVTAKVTHVELGTEDTGVASPLFLPNLEGVQDTEQSEVLKTGC